MATTKGKKPPRQVLVFIRDWLPPADAGCPHRAVPIEVPEEPSDVWTLANERDESHPPALPIVPIHGVNAFAEDPGHDWKWRKGQFRYFSRVTDEPVWVLLVYES